jgi:hypothetical protein
MRRSSAAKVRRFGAIDARNLTWALWRRSTCAAT